MSTLILRKRYSLFEWLSLSIVFMGICTFYFADVAHDEVTELHTKCRYPPSCFLEPPYDLCALRVDGPTVIGVAIENSRLNRGHNPHELITIPVKAVETDRKGLFFSLMAILCNCMGAVLSEKVLKGSASTPFPTQKLQMECTGLPVSLAMSFIVPLYIESKGGKAIWWTKTEIDGSGEGFFQGFDRLTLVTICVNMFQTWMGGLIIKQFSALVAKLSAVFTLLLTVLLSGMFFKLCQEDPVPPTMFSMAFIIASATVLFGTSPKDKAAPGLPQVPARESLISNEPPAIQLEQGQRQ
jgi:hypothetical protein